MRMTGYRPDKSSDRDQGIMAGHSLIA